MEATRALQLIQDWVIGYVSRVTVLTGYEREAVCEDLVSRIALIDRNLDRRRGEAALRDILDRITVTRLVRIEDLAQFKAQLCDEVLPQLNAFWAKVPAHIVSSCFAANPGAPPSGYAYELPSALGGVRHVDGPYPARVDLEDGYQTMREDIGRVRDAEDHVELRNLRSGLEAVLSLPATDTAEARHEAILDAVRGLQAPSDPSSDVLARLDLHEERNRIRFTALARMMTMFEYAISEHLKQEMAGSRSLGKDYELALLLSRMTGAVKFIETVTDAQYESRFPGTGPGWKAEVRAAWPPHPGAAPERDDRGNGIGAVDPAADPRKPRSMQMTSIVNPIGPAVEDGDKD